MVIEWRLATVRSLLCLLLLAGCSSHAQRGVIPQGAVHLTTPQSISPGLIAPAPMAKTAILPPSAMQSARMITTKSAIQGSAYSSIPGAASQVAASPDGSLWVLSTQPAGPDKYIWHYANNAWTNISGLAAHLAVGSGGELYAVNSGGGTYIYVASDAAWYPRGGGASGITADSGNSIYVLSNGGTTTDKAIWRQSGGGMWTQVPGSGVAIAASWDTRTYNIPAGTISPTGLYVLNSVGSIYYLGASGYVQMPGSASAIAPTNGGIFVLAYPTDPNGSTIYYYDLDNTGWSAKGGSGVSISANATTLYATAASNAIYSTSVIRTSEALAAQYQTPTLNSNPRAVALGPDGNVWFTESVSTGLAAGRIGMVTPSGGFSEYLTPTPSQPYGITAGQDGNIWFTEDTGQYSLAGQIGKITPAGVIIEYPISTNPSQPHGITAGPDGNVWFTEHQQEKIGKITPGGVVTEYPLAGGNIAESITTGSDGNLWFTESVSRIVKMTPTGVATYYNLPAFGSGIGAPREITSGPDGNLWFTESPDKIGKITTAGVITQYSVSSNSGPEGIATGPDGNLWFTEQTANQVARITTSGVLTEFPLSKNGGPWGIVTGSDHNIWVAELYGNNIDKFLP